MAARFGPLHLLLPQPVEDGARVERVRAHPGAVPVVGGRLHLVRDEGAPPVGAGPVAGRQHSGVAALNPQPGHPLLDAEVVIVPTTEPAHQSDVRLGSSLVDEAVVARRQPDTARAETSHVRLRLDPVREPVRVAQVLDGVGVAQD